jgi:hypothetical protein
VYGLEVGPELLVSSVLGRVLPPDASHLRPLAPAFRLGLASEEALGKHRLCPSYAGNREGLPFVIRSARSSLRGEAAGLFGSGHERSVRARFAAARPSARLGR